MNNPLDSSSSNASAQNSGHQPQLSALERGLAALKRKEYAIAIAHLEALCDDADTDRRTLAKAQMALVTAYEQMGELKLAIVLCQPLCSSRSSQVRAWASQTLARLMRRDAALETADQPGGDRAVPGLQVSAEPTPGVSSIPNLDSDEVPHAAPKSSLPQPSLPRRAQNWAPIAETRLVWLRLLQIGTAIALFWVVRSAMGLTLSLINALINRIYWIVDLRQYAVYQPPLWSLLLGLAVLLAISPWLLDAILKRQYGLQPLSNAALDRHSSEAIRLLGRVGSKRSLPTLGVLPLEAPLALTYGNLPRTARIVVSQGLLELLSEDELAAIYAAELAHIRHGDVAVLTLVMLVAQVPFLVYWQVSQWGDRARNSVLRAIAAAVAALSYGAYWLVHWTGRWLSRTRLYYSDRAACSLTGNPNGLTRALLKITRGVAETVQQQGCTSPLLESFDLLMPIGHRTALSLGSAFPDLAAPSAYAWDLSNPARVWLALNNAHPRMGDRLQQLVRYARHWRLDPELDLAPQPHPMPRSLQLQAAPFVGMAVGAALAIGLWLVGLAASRLQWYALDWLRGDRSLFWGCVLLGFSFGTFLRINAFFPDIRRGNLAVNPSLAALLSDPAALPTHSPPVQMEGKLLGRRGIENGLIQDLLLKTATGLVKLHYLSPLGTAGNLLLHPHRPDGLVDRTVTVTGWFRRGATAWIDVDTLQAQRGAIYRSGHQLWSTLLAIAAALWGAYTIAQGSL